MLGARRRDPARDQRDEHDQASERTQQRERDGELVESVVGEDVPLRGIAREDETDQDVRAIDQDVRDALSAEDGESGRLRAPLPFLTALLAAGVESERRDVERSPYDAHGQQRFSAEGIVQRFRDPLKVPLHVSLEPIVFEGGRHHEGEHAHDDEHDVNGQSDSTACNFHFSPPVARGNCSAPFHGHYNPHLYQFLIMRKNFFTNMVL